MKTSSSNEPDIAQQLARIQEKLLSLDRKMDSLISKCSRLWDEERSGSECCNDQPVYAHTPVYAPAPVQAVPRPPEARPVKADDHRRERQLHHATCADCQKECEIPFKPSGDRPVYCKECFTQRKTAKRSQAPVNDPPKEALPVEAVVSPEAVVEEAPVVEKKRPAVKKAVAKKKPVPAKKRK